MTNWQPNIPYNQLPDLPPNKDIETKNILKFCISARSALAELNRAAKLIPNQSMLINTLPIMEAQASSEIENIVTTTDKIFQSLPLDNHQADPATKEALQYRSALFEGFASLEKLPICTKTAVLVCNAIKNPLEMNIRQTKGTVIANQSGQIIYTPPEGELVIRERLTNWESFINQSNDLDPLIIMAVAHYQFEAIHPFADGNGRTGRVINSLLLIQKELLSQPILYLSRFIIQNKADYYRLLLNVASHNDWESWIIFMLKGVKETANWTIEKIDAIRKLFEATKSFIQKKSPKIYKHELINILFEQPYIRIAKLEEVGLAKRQTASKYLKELCDIGVLNEIQVGKDKLFVHPRLMEILRGDSNEFAEFID